MPNVNKDAIIENTSAGSMLERIRSNVPLTTLLWCSAGLVITGLLVGGAIFSLALRVFDQPSELAIIFSPSVRAVLIDTLAICVGTTLVTVSVGFILGVVLRFAGLKALWLVLGVVLFPLVADQIIRNYAFYFLFQEGGVWSSLFGLFGVANPPQILYTRTGVVLGISHGLLALSVLPVWLSLQRLSESELRAARVHGARPLDVLRDLVVPASLPGVVVGVFFTFVLTLGYYVTPKMLGGRDGLMLAALVDQYVNNLGDRLGAAALSLLLFGLCLPFILLTPYMLNLLERRT